MYINPFWCGVLATIGIEIAATIVAVIVSEYKKKKKK